MTLQHLLREQAEYFANLSAAVETGGPAHVRVSAPNLPTSLYCLTAMTPEVLLREAQDLRRLAIRAEALASPLILTL
jgi:hypothetical protein